MTALVAEELDREVERRLADVVLVQRDAERESDRLAAVAGVETGVVRGRTQRDAGPGTVARLEREEVREARGTEDRLSVEVAAVVGQFDSHVVGRHV